MDEIHLWTARHFRYVLSAENFQQQFGAREVCRASQVRPPNLVIGYVARVSCMLDFFFTKPGAYTLRIFCVAAALQRNTSIKSHVCSMRGRAA